jgi:hypothetical protein
MTNWCDYIVRNIKFQSLICIVIASFEGERKCFMSCLAIFRVAPVPLHSKADRGPRLFFFQFRAEKTGISCLR